MRFIINIWWKDVLIKCYVLLKNLINKINVKLSTKPLIILLWRKMLIIFKLKFKELGLVKAKLVHLGSLIFIKIKSSILSVLLTFSSVLLKFKFKTKRQSSNHPVNMIQHSKFNQLKYMNNAHSKLITMTKTNFILLQVIILTVMMKDN